MNKSVRYDYPMNSDTTTKQNQVEAIVGLVNQILKPTIRYNCPECGQTFTDPEEYAYGHDCEVES